MDEQTKVAILAITVIIPILSLLVWNSDQAIISASSDSTQITVIASFYPLYEFTKQVGKEKVEVLLLVPPGVEPHDWEPTITDLQKMLQSNLIVINGIGFENWVDDIDTVNSKVMVVDTSEGISLINDSFFQKDENKHHDDYSLTDPHIWLNPLMAKIQVSNIADALLQIDPSNKIFYQENAKSYISKLEHLDEKIKNELSTCKKDFIAFHKAFSYFAVQYELNQHTIINSNNPNIEPTSKTLEEIINLAKNLGINVIFTEEAVNVRTSEVIATEIGARVLVLSTMEIMNENSNYMMKMENNLSNLKEALCT